MSSGVRRLEIDRNSKVRGYQTNIGIVIGEYGVKRQHSFTLIYLSFGELYAWSGEGGPAIRTSEHASSSDQHEEKKSKDKSIKEVEIKLILPDDWTLGH